MEVRYYNVLAFVYLDTIEVAVLTLKIRWSYGRVRTPKDADSEDLIGLIP